MVTLTGLFSRLASVKVAVIGDFMLDTYTIGKTQRISPEAPVAVVNVLEEQQRAGGAGNVVLNLLSLGASVLPIGRLGDDRAGKLLTEIFENENVSHTGFFIQSGYQTPVKNRIIAENQQIVRVDHELPSLLCKELELRIIKALPELFQGIQVIAISDYAKGFLSHTLLSAIFEYAKKHECIVIADPKGVDFSKYQGATIIKPNLSEVYAAANLPRDVPLEFAASKVLELTDAQILMVTRSEAGISLFYREGARDDYPVRVHEVKDVTGAGDTVLAMLAYALASGLKVSEAVPLCNVAASVAIERFGCARISLSDLARRMLELDKGNKIFDCEHVFALQQALKGRKAIALDLTSALEFNEEIFAKIRNLAEKKKDSLLVYLGEADPSSHFATLLKELIAVDYLLFGKLEFKSLCETLGVEES